MNDRAVSVPTNYVMLVGIATLLASGLFLAGGNVVEDRRDEVTRTSLGVAGNRLATDVAALDRLASMEGTDAARTTLTLPDRVAGTAYSVTVETAAAPRGHHDVTLTLTTVDGDVSTSVTVRTAHPVAEGRVAPGDVAVVYDPATDTLEVRDD